MQIWSCLKTNEIKIMTNVQGALLIYKILELFIKDK